ncbi:hypothetical protein [Salininema proteolyticum]|uniref:Uncharacterized protein n=1 Tax=Salininema proteolyticum TaxID=1607685 RepID=A0ABV8TST4_9ACTN
MIPESGPENDPENAGHAALLDVVSLLAEMPWPQPEETDETEQEWELGEFSGSTAWGIMRLVPLAGWSPPRPEDEPDPLVEAMSRRWGAENHLDLGALPDYDPDAETLDVRSLLKTLVQYAGGDRALWWQATRRRIVVAAFDRQEEGLHLRHREERIVGVIVAPTEILDPPADTDPSPGTGRRYLCLASNRLFWKAGDPFVYPWFVDVSVEPAPAKVAVAEGVAQGSMGAVISVAEALGEKWADHFEKAEAGWLRPYLRRILDGERVTEAELIAHFASLHGREPDFAFSPYE